MLASPTVLNVTNVLIIYRCHSTSDVVKSENQFDDSRLAPSSLTNNCSRLARWSHEGDIFNTPFSRLVGERNLFKDNIPTLELQRHCIGLVREGWFSLKYVSYTLGIH